MSHRAFAVTHQPFDRKARWLFRAECRECGWVGSWGSKAVAWAMARNHNRQMNQEAV